MLEFFACYLALGIVVIVLCEESIKQQADQAHSEMCWEAGAEVPYWAVAATYIALALVGWPFFLSVSIVRRK